MVKKRKTFKKRNRKKSSKQFLRVSFAQILSLFVLSVFFFFLPSQNIYSRIVFDDVINEDVEFVDLPSPAPLPVNTTGVYPEYLTVEGIYVEDITSSVSLFERNADQKMAPASTTKMITALIVLDTFSPEDVVSVKTVVDEGRLMGLVEGERITVENLLYGVLIHSGNDAAYTLAENFPGGVENFVTAMNEKAQNLHLNNTNFTNPIGFDDENHYSTPRDLAILAKVVLANKILAKMVGIPTITVSDVSYSIFHPLANVNELVGRVPGVSGVKTGFTENAGESLITVAQRDDRRVLIVVLHSQNRFTETENIINWIFSNYEWQEVQPPV